MERKGVSIPRYGVRLKSGSLSSSRHPYVKGSIIKDIWYLLRADKTRLNHNKVNSIPKSSWRPATEEEILAYESGIKNIKDINSQQNSQENEKCTHNINPIQRREGSGGNSTPLRGRRVFQRGCIESKQEKAKATVERARRVPSRMSYPNRAREISLAVCADFQPRN